MHIMDALPLASVVAVLIGCGETTQRTPAPSEPAPTSSTISATPSPPPPAENFPRTDPAWLRRLASDYPHVHGVGNVRVFSDITLSFSEDHAQHLKLVWDYFDSLFAQNRGEWLDVYYTTSEATFQRVVPHCPTVFVPGARKLTACYLDYPRWFIVPFQTPDFGTQLHEIGHDFLFATWPGSETFPWFKEGTGMYFEAGTFAPDGTLTITDPLPYCTSLFRQYDTQRHLISLDDLLRMPKSSFLSDNERTYSQSCMLFNYLEERESEVLRGLIQGVNSGAVTSNDELIQMMLRVTAKTIDGLEAAYEEHAKEFSG